jgi:hypothetical protein
MELKKAISFDIDPSHYNLSDEGAVVVWCFDDRLNKVGHSMLDELIKNKGWEHKDLVTEPGGAKLLASENADDAAEKQSLLNRIKSGIALHHAKTVILSVHVDCGAYGYSKSFTDGAEDQKLANDLRHAEEFIRKEVPADTTIESYVVEMDGLYRVYPDADFS